MSGLRRGGPGDGAGKACVPRVRKVKQEVASLRPAGLGAGRPGQRAGSRAPRGPAWSPRAGSCREHVKGPGTAAQPHPSPGPGPGAGAERRVAGRSEALRKLRRVSAPALWSLLRGAGPHHPPILTRAFLSASSLVPSSLLPDPGLWSLPAPVPPQYCGSRVSLPPVGLMELPPL